MEMIRTSGRGCARYLLASLLTLCASTLVQADAVTLLQRHLEPVEGWAARFHQVVRDEDGQPQQESRGRVDVLRPNQLRWEVEEPFRYLVVTDGEVLWRYDPDLEQANREPFHGDLADTPGLILSGDPAAIGDRYRVKHQRSGGEEQFTLYPLAEDAPFRRLELFWQNGQLQRLRMLDSLDQSTEVHFEEGRTSPAPAPARFQFDPPPGTDVIDHGG